MKDSLIKNFLEIKTFFSWQGLIKRAIFIVLVFSLSHILNGREFVGAIFGTYNVLGYQRVVGVVYGFFYFLVTIIAPIFLIAALLIFLIEKAGFLKGIAEK